VLVPRIGYCEYFCSLCTQVCPTGALQELTVKEKAEVVIGSAWVKKDRCIPFVLGESCTVCEEQCPTRPKAIRMVETELMMPDGTWDAQRVPWWISRSASAAASARPSARWRTTLRFTARASVKPALKTRPAETA